MSRTLSIARSLWHLARPAGAWAAPSLPLLGYGWAHWDRALMAWNAHLLPWVLVAWLALQTGTLWLNAARDRDDGEVLFGRTVPVPTQAAAAGIAALMLAVVLAWIAHPISGLCAAGAAVLSILYSHPRFVWKAHPVGGPLINVLGYGLLSPAAGYALAETPLTPRTIAIALAMSLMTLGWFYAAQAFQQREDRARGDRTLVATHGPTAVLTLTRICQALVGAIVVGLCLVGWIPLVALLCVPLFLWLDRYVVVWTLQPAGGTEAWARGLAARSVVLLVTLLCIMVVDYATAAMADRPVAGLGTPSGIPYDRSPLPPSEIQRRDRAARHSSGHSYASLPIDPTASPP